GVKHGGTAHQRRSSAADAVKSAHHFGHLDHFDYPGQVQAQESANGYADQDDGQGGGLAEDLEVGKGEDDGHRRGAGAEQVACHRRPDPAHQGNTVEDNCGQNSTDDVIKSLGHSLSPLSNIFSMRWVTPKPPATLIMARTTASPPTAAPTKAL